MRNCSRRSLTPAVWIIVGFLAVTAYAGVSPRNQDGPPRATDKSLAADEYIRRGFPAPDRIWSGDDMSRAVNVLRQIAAHDPAQLPRYRSERSGTTFAALTSARNLELYRSKSLPLDMRFPQGLGYYDSTSQLLKLYLSAFAKQAVDGNELVELYGAGLRASEVQFELVKEFLPTIRTDDEKYPVRMRALENLRQNFGTIVAGAIQCLTERDVYRSEDRIRLAGYMKATFPVIVPVIPKASRTETLVRLVSLAKEDDLKDLRPSLLDLITIVHCAERHAGNALPKPGQNMSKAQKTESDK